MDTAFAEDENFVGLRRLYPQSDSVETSYE